ncbi:ABC transporter ATP-binding protein [Alkalihalobacillus sp. BA299]|uniref:ABC transporter ATP-binding protein n=1 Tax=Alkalihalobacillus sp. BA299 TaxID=2815938 RepID=UPI001ADB56D8|nr:sn-glycerol-3-phosphate ABC transporter ATP-binding protein UgpC [Alkalihalobacillus sp. BA299]
MANINLKNIRKVYDKNVTAVEDFNLEVKNKEFIVFVGPSGCGKSTTLRMIAGLEDISEGELYIGDRVVNDVAPKDRDIAMVFQNYALYPHMTVYDNMAFGLKLRKFKKHEIKARVEEAAKILGLETMLDRKPKALSGGQRQRVALGRAIVRDPQVFLMDEPLSNLDAKLRVQMRAEITKLHKRLNATTIYVTHDQTEAMTMATRIVVMKDGVIQQVGSPKEVYDYPANLFVGGFIGSPSMNFIEGTFHQGKFTTKHVEINVPNAKKEMLESMGYEGKSIILGIRPEHIYYDKDAGKLDGSTEVSVNVDVAELMGSETFLYCDLEDQKIIARVDATQSFHNGQAIKLNFDLEKAHFFDRETEKRILIESVKMVLSL